MELNNPCPWCSKRNDQVTDASGQATPLPGDITMCETCGGWSFFNDELVLRKPTDEEWAEVSQMEEVQQVSQIWVRTFGNKS